MLGRGCRERAETPDLLKNPASGQRRLGVPRVTTDVSLPRQRRRPTGSLGRVESEVWLSSERLLIAKELPQWAAGRSAHMSVGQPTRRVGSVRLRGILLSPVSVNRVADLTHPIAVTRQFEHPGRCEVFHSVDRGSS